MSNLLYKTRGMVNPKGKPRVYFTCCEDAFDVTFNKVCDDILSVSDCAIYYTENMNQPFATDELEMTLGLMNLFVIPVTRNLLEKPNRAMDVDFSFALKNGIPVLPIVFESGLDGIYSRKDRFGELQYINPFSSDLTEIGYEEKLKKFLDSVLISDATSKRIRAEFDAYMFLSYRKKDRRYANELMRIIHSNRECRDIAVWYDEFLVPGESFNENITKMMSESKLFALLVTPNLLEINDGVPNFVMGKEYPAARELGMEIVPTEMENTDKVELLERFRDLPECVDPYKQSDFRNRLIQALEKVAITTNDCDPEHNYLIGLAYRDGIDVEVDRQRGLELIKNAAEAGWAEAASELTTMYYYGFYVKKDYEQAAYWQKKKIESLRLENKNNPTAKSKFDLVDALRFYTEIARNGIGNQDTVYELVHYCEEALELCDEYNSTNMSDEYTSSRFVESTLNTLRSLAILYEIANEFDSAVDTYNQALKYWHIIAEADKDIDDEQVQILNKWRVAQIHHDIGVLQGKRGNYSESVSELEKALEIYYELIDDSSDFLPNMISVHNAIAQDAVHCDVSKAVKHSEIALELSKSLYESNKSLFDTLYADTLLARAFVLSEIGSSDLDEIEKISLESATILLEHKDEGSHETLFNLMNVLYKVASVYRRKCNWDKAREYYLEAIKVSDTLLSATGIEDKDKEAVAHLFFDFGTFSIAFSEGSDFEMSVNALHLSLELFKDVSVTKPQCKQYVEETESVLLTIVNKIGTTSPQNMRAKLEENDPEKVAAFYQFQYFYEKGDSAERERSFEKAILNYKSALEQLDIIEKLGAPAARLTLADIYDRIALCYEMLKEYDEAKQYYAQAMLLAAAEAKETDELKAYDSAINYAWKLASFCEEFGDEDEAKKHYAFREFLIEEKSKLESNDDASEESFLSPEKKAELLRKLDELDFTPTTFKKGEEVDYSEGLFTDEDGDHTLEALFDTLFGIDDDSNDVAPEEDPTIITLTDQDGEDVRFEFVDLIKFQGNEYVVLIPQEDGEDEVLILMVESDDGQESYLPVEDEVLLSVLFELFKERNKDRFNFTD